MPGRLALRLADVDLPDGGRLERVSIVNVGTRLTIHNRRTREELGRFAVSSLTRDGKVYTATLEDGSGSVTITRLPGCGCGG